MLQAQQGSKTNNTLGFKLFTVRDDTHPLGQAWLLLQQKEVEQLPSAQALPSHQEPPMEKKEEWLGCSKYQTFPLQGSHVPPSHPHCLSCKAKLDAFPHTLTLAPQPWPPCFNKGLSL